MSVITWNMANQYQKVFEKAPSLFFKEVDLVNTHLIAITAQECVKKNYVMDYIEKFLHGWQFENVDTSFCSQWQMFLIIFIKSPLKPLISNVHKTVVAKGKFNMVGNKGGLITAFTLNGRVISFIGEHLIHAPKNYIRRN
jgi:hypothetical protein